MKLYSSVPHILSAVLFVSLLPKEMDTIVLENDGIGACSVVNLSSVLLPQS